MEIDEEKLSGSHIGTDFEELAARLIRKYPDGYLVGIEKIETGFGLAIRAHVRGLDSPVTILVGGYNDLRTFENTYMRCRYNPEEQSPIDRIT